MPLPTAVNRERIHRRSVVCDAFRREDGLWDIDAYMSDVKDHKTEANVEGRTVEAGDPFHDMGLRITIDQRFLIHEVHATMDATPFKMCPRITGAFKKLEGTRIGPGWSQKTKDLLSGVQGCTHLYDLLKPVSTTAIQAIFPMLNDNIKQMAFGLVINSCHSWGESSQVVRDHFPQFYVPLSNTAK